MNLPGGERMLPGPGRLLPGRGRSLPRPASTRPDLAKNGSGPGRNRPGPGSKRPGPRSEEHTSELQSRRDLVCRLLLEKKNKLKKDILNLTNERYITRPSS